MSSARRAVFSQAISVEPGARVVFSQAISVEPLPPKTSSTTAPGSELLRIGYSSSATGFMEDTISFPIALSAPIASSKIVWTFNKSQAPFCEGPGHASPGYMCIYSAGHVNIEQPEFSNPEVVGGKANETGIHGVDVGWETVSGGKEAYDYGTWSVTAP